MALLSEKEARRPEAWRFWREVLHSPRTVVAPMVDVSVLPFRLLCKRHGADVCYTQMFHAASFARDIAVQRKLFQTCPEDQPLFAQLAGNDPQAMAESARVLEGRCAAVDVNLGCPQKIARKGNYGAFIAEKHDVCSTIVTTMSAYQRTPVTCKIRLQETPEETLDLARKLEEAGCKVLCVHGRKRTQLSLVDTRADWEAIAKVVQAMSIPVIANGDIKCKEDVDRCLKITGAQAVMAGSGAMANPALFSGENIPHWALAEEFVDLCVKHETPVSSIRGILVKMTVESITKFIDLREALVTAESIVEVRSVVAEMKYRALAQIASPPALPEDFMRPKWAWDAPNGDVEIDVKGHEGWIEWHEVTVHHRAPLLSEDGPERPGERWVQFGSMGRKFIPIATLRRFRDMIGWRAWDCRHSYVYIDVKDEAVFAELVQKPRVMLHYNPVLPFQPESSLKPASAPVQEDSSDGISPAEAEEALPVVELAN